MLGFIIFIVIYATGLFHVGAEQRIWPRFLYREVVSPPIEELSSLVAALQFDTEITFMETLGPVTCKRSFYCPLAGLIMVGDSKGTLKFISHAGDQVISVDSSSICSGDTLCAITAARVVHFRGSREHEALVIAHFSGKGIHAMLLNYETRSHGVWENMVSSSSNACVLDVVDIQVITGKMKKNSPWNQIDYVVILDAGGNVFVGKDLALDWTDRQPDATVESPSKWEMDFLRTDIMRIHADENSGIVMVDNQQSILSFDRQLAGIKSLCDDVFMIDENTKIIDASFDSSESILYVAVLLDNDALIRLKISKNECSRMQSIYTLGCWDQNSCIPKLVSSGGYTMMTHKECGGTNSLTLYNHSEILSRRQNEHPWNPMHYVASSSTEEAMLRFFMAKAEDRLPGAELAKALNYLLVKPQDATNCLQAKLQMWNHKNLLGKQLLAFLLPNAKVLVLFRPLFSPNEALNGSKAAGMHHIIVGILKSLTLIIAAVAGLRWAGAKKGEIVTGPPTMQRLFDMKHYNSKGMDIGESYGRYRRDNYDIRHRLSRIAKEHLNRSQINVDRAPQYPQSRIRDANECSTDEDSSLELEEETM